jgi:hypothetical protein
VTLVKDTKTKRLNLEDCCNHHWFQTNSGGEYMDCITHIPKNRNENDAITVLVDRLNEMVRIHPGKSIDTVKDIAQQFKDVVYRNHGLLCS